MYRLLSYEGYVASLDLGADVPDPETTEELVNDTESLSDLPTGTDGATLQDVYDAIQVTNSLLGYVVAFGIVFAMCIFGLMLYKIITHNVTKFID